MLIVDSRSSNYSWSGPLVPIASIRADREGQLRPHVSVSADVSTDARCDRERGWLRMSALDASARRQTCTSRWYRTGAGCVGRGGLAPHTDQSTRFLAMAQWRIYDVPRER